jgi:hypothetical protein
MTYTVAASSRICGLCRRQGWYSSDGTRMVLLEAAVEGVESEVDELEMLNTGATHERQGVA